MTHECCPACAKFVAGWDDETDWLIEWWGGCCCVDTANKARAQFPRDWTCEAHGDECSKLGLDWDCNSAVTSMPQYATKEKL